MINFATLFISCSMCCELDWNVDLLFFNADFSRISAVSCRRLNLRRVWRCQRGNQNPNILEEQTTQWSKEKVQKNKQRSTKYTHKTKDRVIRTPLKTGGELRCSGRVSSYWSTSDTRRVNLITNPVISHEWGKNREVFTTRYAIYCLLCTFIVYNKSI